MGEGANRKEITAWAITGVSNSPIPVWADANNKFFGFNFFLSWLPEEHAGEHQRLAEAQTAALSARAPALRKSLLKTPAGAVAFQNVQVFDADARKFLADHTVVRRQGTDHRRRPVEVGEGARRRAGDRRARQDAAARAVGLPHAHWQ